jgi:PAS domain S-box-containing protein
MKPPGEPPGDVLVQHQGTMLNDSEERFRSAFEFAAIGMGLAAPSGRWLRVNDALCRLVGYSANELLAVDFQSISHADDLDDIVDFHRRMLEGSVAHHETEKRYIHRTGTTIWILLSVSLIRNQLGQPLYFVSQAQDITARKNAEQRLRESELRYRTVADLTPGFVFEAVVVAKGPPRPTWASDGFERVHGCTLETFKQLGYEHFYSPATLERMTASALQTAAGKDAQIEVALRALDGVHRWLRVSARPLHDPTGSRRAMVIAVAEDITERKQLERRLMELTHDDQRRVGTQIHEGLGQELAGLALLGEALATKAARLKVPLAADAAALVTLIGKTVESCRGIARVASPLTESHGALVPTIRQLVKHATGTHPPNLRFSASERVAVSLNWDTRSHLFRIVQEALDNALAHSRAMNIHVRVVVDHQWVRVAVADDGCGIPANCLERGGLGLQGMRFRANAIDARLRIERRPRGGTLVECKCAQQLTPE